MKFNFSNCNFHSINQFSSKVVTNRPPPPKTATTRFWICSGISGPIATSTEGMRASSALKNRLTVLRLGQKKMRIVQLVTNLKMDQLNRKVLGKEM
jgi:hypothetical protein